MIKIGSLFYKVIFEKCGAEAGMNVSAQMSNFYQNIRIDMDNRPFDGMEQDLWHEIIEAVNGIYNLKLEHQTISTLGSAIHQVLRDNAVYLADFKKIVEKEKG